MTDWRSLAMAIAMATILVPSARAQTMDEALAYAYSTNPDLEAQRRRLMATDELLPQAKSGYRPSLQIDADGGVVYSDNDISSSDTSGPVGGSFSVIQPLYRGGKTTSEVSRAKNLIQSERAFLYDLEQLVLFDSVVAYMDVVRDEVVAELARNNEKVITRQLEATRDRFEVGEVTRTDVAQAEARLASAISDRIAAEGNVIAAHAAFLSVIGLSPVSVSPPGPLAGLPNEEAHAQQIAAQEHPSIIAADFTESAALDDVRIAEGDLLPELRLRGELSRAYNTARFVDRQDAAALLAELTIPLYEAGFTHSRIRENKLIAAQRRIEASQVRRDVAQIVTRSWEAFLTAEAQIESFSEGVRAAEIALDGLEREALVGSRTVLDVLDGEQELFEARVDLVRAERDLVVASYALQAAIGRLSAAGLRLAVEPFDVERYYEKVKDAWWGTGIE